MIDPFALDEAPYGEPLSLVIGQSTQWRRSINIDGAIHTLRYVLRHYAPSGVSIDYSIDMVSVSDGVFAADVSAANISGWSEGRYFWDLVVVRTSDDRSTIIETGEIRVFDSSAERRSHAEIMVGKIESVLEGRADADVESYTIKSRSITKMAVKELREWRDYYVREIKNQPADAGLFAAATPSRDTLRVRFKD